MTDQTRPIVSIVVEWDNIRLVDAERAVEVLGALSRETAAWDGPLEVLLLYDEHLVDPRVPKEALARTDLESQGHVRIELVPTAAGLRYTELKNEGVRHATGDIVAFCDSDARPEEGWLAELLAPFEDPAVQVTAGSTYIEPTDRYSRAVALFWIFPLRAEDGDPHPGDSLYANNAAFRRHVLQEHPFRRLELYRRQSGILAKDLLDAGITIWRVPQARSAHPPFDRRRFFVRGLWAGRDDCLTKEAPSFRISLRILKRQLKKVFGNVRAGYRHMGLGPLGGTYALALGIAYYGTAWVGFLLTRWKPDLLPSRFEM